MENGEGNGSTARRVLLIDDDASVRACVESVLSEAGYFVTAVADAASALRCATQEPFAAVVCDQGLGPTTGLELLRRFAAIKPSLVRRFILATGAESDEACRAFAAVRPERTLFKPFTNDALLTAVGRVVAATTPAPSGL